MLVSNLLVAAHSPSSPTSRPSGPAPEGLLSHNAQSRARISLVRTQFGDQAALQRAKHPFAAPARLGRIGHDVLHAEPGQLLLLEPRSLAPEHPLQPPKPFRRFRRAQPPLRKSIGIFSNHCVRISCSTPVRTILALRLGRF